MASSEEESSMSPPAIPTSSAPKRTATVAGLDGEVAPRPVKRRASKACQCCRSRKVRCNVTEHGAPCTNCRLDEVECIVSESRRKKKWNKDSNTSTTTTTTATNSKDSQSPDAKARKLMACQPGSKIKDNSASAAAKVSGRAGEAVKKTPASYAHPLSISDRKSHDVASPGDGHVSHSIYQQSRQLNVQQFANRLQFHSPSSQHAFPMLHPSPLSTDGNYFSPSIPRQPAVTASVNIPYFIKPLPPRVGADEVHYLEKKGALTIPNNTLRNELIRAYVEFVHPYMPLLDLYDFLLIIETGNGTAGRISLILYHAVMFAGSAFVDMQHLYNAGYSCRKDARKDFFNKTRLLYDFDYESDRVSLVQALLLLTYYYETPDDQKDTWHWMGVATSVAHTIGLHRNPERSNLDAKRAKLWKRIWWSTYMRDRLIALGMRRPTRIKMEDYDVPMISLDDFEFKAIPESWSCLPAECTVARDLGKQRELAIMCIEKAKLCLLISEVLSRQYCVLNNHQGVNNDRTTMMLLPKKLDPETSEVKSCDRDLQNWLDQLPPEAQQKEAFTGDAPMDLCRSLLHLVFWTTLSALHRPQVLPATPHVNVRTPAAMELLECSRQSVRRAATAITRLAQSLDTANLVRYLPTTGVTVLLPAIIIHLLDIKSPDDNIRRSSLRGFCQCMAVMGKLRDMYTAADYSIAFLEAAIRKAGIHVSTFVPLNASIFEKEVAATSLHPVTTVEDLVDAGRRLDMTSMPPPPSTSTLTPPPDHNHSVFIANLNIDDAASPPMLAHPASPPAHHLHLPQQQQQPHAARAFSTLGLGIDKTGLIIPAAARTAYDDDVAVQLKSFLASTPPASDHEQASASSDVLDALSATNIDASTTTMFTDTRSPTGIRIKDIELSGGAHQHALLGAIPEQDEFDSLIDVDAMAEQGNWSFDDGGVHGFTVDMDWLGASAD